MPKGSRTNKNRIVPQPSSYPPSPAPSNQELPPETSPIPSPAEVPASPVDAPADVGSAPALEPEDDPWADLEPARAPTPDLISFDLASSPTPAHELESAMGAAPATVRGKKTKKEKKEKMRAIHAAFVEPPSPSPSPSPAIRAPTPAHAPMPVTPSPSRSPAPSPAPVSRREPSPHRTSGSPAREIPGRGGRRVDVVEPEAPLAEPSVADEEPADDGPEWQNGHVREPVLSRDPSLLTALSRTVASYLPLPMPFGQGASAAPPRVSRPVSFGTFTLSSGGPSSPSIRPREVSRDAFDDEDGADLAHAHGDDDERESESERVKEARWDEASGRRLLVLVYASGGLQVWDTTDLGSVTEVLNLSSAPGGGDGRVVYASTLPAGVEEEGRDVGGVLGVVCEYGNSRDKRRTELLAYGLRTHRVLRRADARGAERFEGSDRGVVLSSTHPAALHILTLRTLSRVHTIPASALALFPIQQQPLSVPSSMPPPAVPTPVFALSARCLAYASTSSAAPTTVLSRMRALGGLAMRAAVDPASRPSTPSGISSLFFSKSAPAETERERERRRSIDASSSKDTPSTPPATGASFVTVLDLTTRTPIACFPAFKRHALAGLRFAPDGTKLVAVPKDGTAMRVFAIRPKAKTPGTLVERAMQRMSVGTEAEPGTGVGDGGDAWDMYELRRGRTGAVVEGVEVSGDGRWVGVGTGRGTVHVWATNPFGGRTEERGHLEGRVRNVDELQPLGVELAPLVRLRASKAPPAPHVRAGLAFAFLAPSASPQSTLPQVLRPPALPPAPASPSSSPRLEPLSPRRPTAPRNLQDVLLFEPRTGELSLRRVWVEKRARGEGLMGLAASMPRTSASVPSGVGAFGRLGVSPPGPGWVAGEGEEVETELVGRESVVATWAVKRGREWEEVRGRVGRAVRMAPRITRADSLSQAELSTHSSSPAILPRSIYLSHQFTFHSLGHDYHALLRRLQLSSPHLDGEKIEVRREVFASTDNASLGTPASFDAPLGAALSARVEVDRAQLAKGVLPMYPNGRPRGYGIPIRVGAVASGIGDGVGRVKREMARVRSPPKRSAARERLEFDEEDEDFAARGGGGEGVDPERTPGPEESWGGGWEAEDANAVEDAERFDHIEAVGFLDEEQAEMRDAERARMRGRDGKRKK